jgi:hypothetical protein
MHNTMTPHYAQELKRVRRKKSLTQLKWVGLALFVIVVIPMAVLLLIGYLGM